MSSPELPSLDLLRGLSDRHVLCALVESPVGLTRAQVAAQTGLSKPTVSQSIGRLLAQGTVVEGGLDRSGRGRAGTTLTLSPTAGCGLALHAGPTGVTGELVAADATVVCRLTRPVTVPTSARKLSAAIRGVAEQLARRASGPLLALTVSVADPVDQATGRTVHLPDAPFLTGDVDLRRALNGLSVSPVIDNDVNWAARAEQRIGCAREDDTFVFVHLGEGIGAGLVLDGALTRGSRGLAGEIAQLTVPHASLPHRAASPRGRHTLVQAAVELGLTRPDSAAIDVVRLLSELDRGTHPSTDLVHAVTAVLGNCIRLLDPSLIVLGGPWGTHPRVLDLVQDAVTALPAVRTRVELTQVADDAPLAGARLHAAELLLEALAPTGKNSG